MFVMKCLLVLFVIVIDIGFFSFARNCMHLYKNQTTIKYYTKPNNDLIIPIMVHVDKPLIGKLPKHRDENKYMRRERLMSMTKYVFKHVQRIFGHPSLNQTIRLMLLDVKVLRSNFSKVVMDKNVSAYLKSYCTWQGEKKTVKRKWFYSVLLSGLDLYYMDASKKKIRSSTGRGYMKGLCSVSYSCTILKWQHNNLPYILAHELAHSLGIPHDGLPNSECQDQRYIMNAKYNPANPATNWSPCSRSSLQQFLKSNKAWCLQADKRNMVLI